MINDGNKKYSLTKKNHNLRSNAAKNFKYLTKASKSFLNKKT